MSYEWDIFISYPHSRFAKPWVHNHFKPLLEGCLEAVLPAEPRIFLDTEQPTGGAWPNRLRNALQRSKLLVAVWTPPYFQSNWCMAEWETMLAREEIFQKQKIAPERGLIYPVVYSDGDHFDVRAQNTQQRADLRMYTFPFDGFRDSSSYVDFYNTLMEISEEIEVHLSQVPDWQPGWPIVETNGAYSDRINFVEL